MTGDGFDPFALPSAFDPLGREDAEPAGQPACPRPEPPSPRRRVAAAPVPGAGAGGRLAHLLAPVAPPGDEALTRLAVLERQVATLTDARLAQR